MNASRRSLRRCLLLLVFAVSALALGASSALAADASLASPPHSARAGQVIHLTIRLSGNKESCQLHLLSGGRTRKSSKNVEATRQKLTWTWTVPKNARSAAWTVKAACTRASMQDKISVHARGGHALVLANSFKTTSSGALLSAPSSGNGGNSGGGSGSGGAGGSGGSGSGGGSGPPANPSQAIMCSGADGPNCEFPQGGCEYYAYEMRPDIVNRDTSESMNWNAGYWAANAQAEGYSVDTNPQPGDIAVWEYDGGPGPDGHVAYVDSYDPSGDEGAGSMVVSEMDYDGNPNVTSRTVDDPNYGGILFIHQWS